MDQLQLISTKDKSSAIEKAIEQGAILFVEPSPSITGNEYFVHDYDPGVRGKLILVGAQRSMNIFSPVVTQTVETGDFHKITIENLKHLEVPMWCP